MIVALAGLIIGVILGIVIPMDIPSQYSFYISIGILAALDTLFGGIRANLEDKFEMDVFISGFIGNVVLAVGLAYIGDRLDVPIYLAAIFAFGYRLFNNFASIRRIFLLRYRVRKQKDKAALPIDRHRIKT